jgi:IS30 family transposase
MNRLNNRPRKTLGYKTPNEVFFSGGHDTGGMTLPVALIV